MWSFPIGRLLAIRIRIHWSFPLFVLSEFLKPRSDLSLTAAWLLILFLTVLIHEYGHCLMARRLGQQVHEIMLWPLGGLAYIAPSRTAADDIKVTLAGPLVHIPLALLFTIGLFALGDPPTLASLNPFNSMVMGNSWWTLLMHYGLMIQVVLFCFNLLLPVYPLDGGRIFVAYFSTRWPAKRVAYVACALTLVAVLAFLWHGMLLMGLFVGFSAFQLFMLARRNALEMHPMFHYAPRSTYRPAARPRHLKMVKSAPKPPPPPPPVETKPSPREQDIDRILDKIRIEGMAALTSEEKNLLDEHSSRLRGGR